LFLPAGTRLDWLPALLLAGVNSFMFLRQSSLTVLKWYKLERSFVRFANERKIGKKKQ